MPLPLHRTGAPRPAAARSAAVRRVAVPLATVLLAVVAVGVAAQLRHHPGAAAAATVATLLAVLVAAGHVLLGRPRTQFAETAGLLVVGVGGALLYGLLPSSPAFLLA